MTRQYVSICGHSGVGKKTLIGRLLSEAEIELRERFQIFGSTRAFGKGFEDWKRIMDAEEDCLLHFFQDGTERQEKRITSLKSTFPDHRHRIILLWRPWDIHSEALLARNTPEYRPTPEDVKKNWFEMRVPQFNAISAANHIPIELVKSVDKYAELTEWPRP